MKIEGRRVFAPCRGVFLNPAVDANSHAENGSTWFSTDSTQTTTTTVFFVSLDGVLRTVAGAGRVASVA